MTPTPDTIHTRALRLHTTHELIEHYDQATTIPRSVLELAIPAAVDALYTNRDSGGNMHSAAAAAAVAALCTMRWRT